MSNLHPETDRCREDTEYSPDPNNNLASTRLIIEMDYGITVYPPETDGSPWRAVFIENGVRHFRQAATEELLAGKLEQVRLRLAFDASNMERPGADLIAHYLNPDRLPVENRWSRKHTYSQRRLCRRFTARSSTRSPARTSGPATCSRS